MRKIAIGVMGPGAGASATDIQNAYELGKLIAQAGWVLLTGGRNVGVMDAANKGAKVEVRTAERANPLKEIVRIKKDDCQY